MTAPFVTELRAAGEVVILGGGNGSVLHLRLQSAELWDVMRVDAAGSESVAIVKAAGLTRFFPNGANSDEFVVKLRGFEVLNEDETLDATGVKDGSTLLLARRRRRPVKS